MGPTAAFCRARPVSLRSQSHDLRRPGTARSGDAHAGVTADFVLADRGFAGERSLYSLGRGKRSGQTFREALSDLQEKCPPLAASFQAVEWGVIRCASYQTHVSY